MLIFCCAATVCRVQRRHAATVLQSTWRMQLVRQQLLVAKAAAVVVQAAWRGHQARLRCAKEHGCTARQVLVLHVQQQSMAAAASPNRGTVLMCCAVRTL